ncbi:hypothetical protein HYFRA_00012296 [Hymenoscyphus fraxineus]|uniref:Transcription elongation factor S-II n=1 Tax=Hymenoscyphus fraxineus TaxID=746836 RepID=A0A9N9PRE9_9HELO|nr:hypothetical protein HYFRA_00012296 [Hymenoscyphus fraxineus]
MSGIDQRELDSRLKSLAKAVQDKEPADVVTSILESLKKDVVPTEDLLRSTKAGMIVSKQKGNPNKDIARLATEIISKWKKIIGQNKQKTMAHSTPTNGAASSPAPAPTTAEKGFTGDVTKRRWNSENVDIKRTQNPPRDSCIGLMFNGLAFMSSEPATQILIKAQHVEQAAWDIFKGDTPEYRSKLRSLFQNLKNKDNQELRTKVFSGEISAKSFVTMTDDELKSAKRVEDDKSLEQENLRKSEVPTAKKSISDALRCGQCKQKKVSYSQAQTRSADEPMTTFCECTVCGNRWKNRFTSRVLLRMDLELGLS